MNEKERKSRQEEEKRKGRVGLSRLNTDDSKKIRHPLLDLFLSGQIQYMLK